MRALIYNPDDAPVFSGPASRLELEAVSAQALRAGAERLAQNSQLPLLLVATETEARALAALLRELRQAGFGGPLLVLGKGSGAALRADLLYAGADDVLERPVDPRELEARVSAISRRQHGVLSDSVSLGELVFYLDGRHPEVSGQEVRLSSREYDILRHLVLNAGRVVSKSAIYDALYALCAMPPFEKIIDVYICRLRAKIAKASQGGSYIATVPGRGYSLRKPSAGAELLAAAELA